MLALRDALMAQADFAPGTYPFYGALDASESTEHIAQTLRYAVALNPGSSSLRWAWGRAALAAGDAKAAAGALEPLVGKATHQPLLYSDALAAFSRGGQPEAATKLYELAPPPQQTLAISDTLALAYLEQGSRGALERAIVLRPGDLYANYYLWKQAQEAGDIEATAIYSETLVYFPLEAIDPTDERLLGYAANVIPNLLEDELWDREKTLNVVSYLVWQHHEAPGVERLLEQLVERYPTEPEWTFYLAELYHRRWQIEVDFRSIKTHMGMEMLRCKTAEMVKKEIAVHLLAYNLIRANIARAACLNDKEPRHLSFMAVVQLMRNTASLCITLTGTALEKIIYPLLIAMAQTEIGQRSRPNQPRVIKRRPKGYPIMTKPRSEYATS